MTSATSINQLSTTPSVAAESMSTKSTNGTSNATQAASTSPTNTKMEGLQTEELLFPAADVKHFVGGLNLNTTEEQLQAHFEKFGAVKDVKVMRDSATGRSRGFAFVTMAEPSSKLRVMAEKEHVVAGEPITVRPYAEQHELRRGATEGLVLRRKIFVGGVNPALGQEVLDNYFSKYGPLDDAQIIKYPDGKSRGFGFVVFKDESACQQVLAQPSHNVTSRDRVEVRACLSRSKALRQQVYGSNPAHAMSHGGAYDGYGYGAGNYGGYGQGYGAYNPYGGSPAPWHGSEYHSEGGYDAYGGYYNWGGYSPQGMPAGGARASVGGRDQYSHDATVSSTRGMTSANSYATTKPSPARPSAGSMATQMTGNPIYNPVRRAGIGPTVVPVSYGAVRRPGPY